MNLRKLLIVGSGLLISSNLLASGGTSSGGGNSINNSINPWFLENTTEVSYCLEIDESNMGVSRSRGISLIQDALQYWKSEFASSKNNNYRIGELEPYAQVRVATQVFNFEDCQDSTDLKFQFGILASDQVELLESVGEVVGIAMRTSYDVEQMRGSGFIYIAPQTGPLRPSSTYFGEQPWEACNNCTLEAVLKHELGHVFGLPHDQNDNRDIMNRNFPADVSSESFELEILQNGQFLLGFLRDIRKSYFNFENEPMFIGSLVDFEPKGLRSIFGLNSKESIIRMIEEPSRTHPSATDYIFEASDVFMQKWNRLGNLCWGISRGEGSRSVIQVYIDRGQQVFSKIPQEYYYGYLEGHSKVYKLEISGSLCSDRGTLEVPLLLRQEANGDRGLSTVVDGRIDLDWFQDEWQLR